MKKVLLYDLETTPNIGYTWGMYEQNVLAVKKNWELLSVAYKWLGEPSIECLTRQGEKTDRQLTKKLWSLLNTADIVIAHNGDAFDNKKANAKFIEHGLTPPKPTQSIDTLKIAKRKFKFNSNRLNDLGKLLGVGAKVQTGGFDLWLGCMKGDQKAWDTMIKYNKQDVRLLERVYLKLRPWSASHPNLSERGLDECPKCGSNLLERRGKDMTKAGIFQRYQCKSCGGWCRDKTAEKRALKHKIVNES